MINRTGCARATGKQSCCGDSPGESPQQWLNCWLKSPRSGNCLGGPSCARATGKQSCCGDSPYMKKLHPSGKRPQTAFL